MNPFDEFCRHDRQGLARLTAAQRQAQITARRELHTYIDQMWDNAKARQLDPATHSEWFSVAAARDISSALLAQAERPSRRDRRRALLATVPLAVCHKPVGEPMTHGNANTGDDR